MSYLFIFESCYPLTKMIFAVRFTAGPVNWLAAGLWSSFTTVPSRRIPHASLPEVMQCNKRHKEKMQSLAHGLQFHYL